MLNDIKNSLFNLTSNVTKHSGNLIKTTKLSVNLAQEQEALKSLYTEIGKKVHEIYQYGGSLGKFFDEKYLEIEAAEAKIKNLKEEIAKVKGVKECPKCGKQVDKLAEFCPKCGQRLDAPAPLAAEAAQSETFTPEFNSTAGFAPGETYPPMNEAPSGAFTPPTGFAPVNDTSPTPAPIPAIPPEITPPPETPIPAPSIVAAPAAKKICRVCGKENDADTKFCLSCGRYL